MELYLLLGVTGMAGGLIAGTVGLAGGIFIVPALVALLGTQAMGEAIAISFFAVLTNSLSATLENRKLRGPAGFRALTGDARWYTLGAGSAALFVAGAFGRHPQAIPTTVLASLQLLLATCMLVPRRWYEHLRAAHSPWKDTSFGSLVGAMSTLIGVGGGTYTIFYFLMHGRSIKDCTATSNFVGIFIGLMGLVGYHGAALAGGATPAAVAIDGWGQLILIGAGFVATPLGVRWQSRLPAVAIRRAVVLSLALSSSWVLLRP